jgi:hypothetical protein
MVLNIDDDEWERDDFIRSRMVPTAPLPVMRERSVLTPKQIGREKVAKLREALQAGGTVDASQIRGESTRSCRPPWHERVGTDPRRGSQSAA